MARHAQPDPVTSWWRGVSLRAKITGVTVGLLVIGLFAAGVGTVMFVRNTLIANLNASLEALATNDLASGLFDIEITEAGAVFTPRDDVVAPDYVVAVYSPDGALLAVAGGNRDAGPAFPEVFTLEDTHIQGLTPFVLPAADGSAPYHASVDVLPMPGVLFTQMVALPLSPIERTAATFFGIFAILAFITIAAGAIMTRVLVTQAFRQLGQVESAATAIAAGDFRQRLAPGDPRTEVGKLTGAINTMLDHVDTSLSERDATVRQMRRFIGDASHELRTPLVTVRGYAELYRMGAIRGDDDTAQAMARIEGEAKRMGVMVEDLLALARLDERREVDVMPVDLRRIARDAAMDVRAAAPQRTVTVLDLTAAPVGTGGRSAGTGSRSAETGTVGRSAETGTGTGSAGAVGRSAETGAVGRSAETGAGGRSTETGTRAIRTAAEASGAAAGDAAGRRRGETSRADGSSRGDADTPRRRGGAVAGAAAIARVPLSLLRRTPRPVPAPRAGADGVRVDPIDLSAPEAGPAIMRPPVVLGDENRVRQVVANLLGNARRFSPEASPIEIMVGTDQEHVTEHAPIGMGWIAIVDHGEGVPEQIRSNIFERFWRADTSRARETGGTGLGLAIVASIVDALHGEVTVDDTPGGGATFRVLLPLAPESTLYLDTQPLPELLVTEYEPDDQP